MNKSFKYLTILHVICFFCLAHLASSQQSKDVKVDSSNIDVNYFEDNITERHSGNDYNYSINDTGGVNLIQRVLRKFFKWLGDIFGFDIDLNYQTLEYIVYGILGLGALYLLIQFLLQSPASSVFKTNEQHIEGFNYTEENINEVNFDKLLKDAIKQKNYRLATRYLYLKSLKNLTNKNIIDWHFDKTNSEYLDEISDDVTKSLFKRISYIYDYVWYGEFSIDENTYNSNLADFTKLNNQING